MTGTQHRPSVPDRARRRAIRALAARIGVSYSVAARLLAARSGPIGVTAADDYRQHMFAVRERRSFDLRVRDTRLAVDLPMGRAAHLVERFPPMRWARPDSAGATVSSDGFRRSSAGVAALYDGESRLTMLALLYAVIAHESPLLLPGPEELAWVAEFGEETAVDITCAAPDRAARLLLDGDRWQLWTRVEAALVAGEASPSRPARDAALALGRELRTVGPRGSVDGARQILDALLVNAYEGHAPGTRVRVMTGPRPGSAATVVGVDWPRSGPPTGYQVRADDATTTLSLGPAELTPLDRAPLARAPLDRSTRPEEILT